MALELHETIQLRINQLDVAGRWKMASILVEMQELGERHAGELGFPREFLVRSGMCWVLYIQRIEMRAYPGLGDTVHMITWPGPIEGLFFPRRYRFERPDGTLYGEAATSWVLLSLENRRLLRPSALPGTLLVNTRRTSDMPMPGALRMDGLEPLCRRSVVFSDLDINGHMNNARYAEWVCDLLDADRLRADGLKSLQINYIAEGRLGEEAQLNGVNLDGRMLIRGAKTADGRRMFEAEAVYMPPEPKQDELI